MTRVVSEEIREKIGSLIEKKRKDLRGKKNPFYGKHHSEESLTKMKKSASRVDEKERRSKLMTKRWADPDFREKQSELIRNAHRDPALRKKRSEQMTTLHKVPGFRENKSEMAKKQWNDPALREKTRGAMKAVWTDPENYTRHFNFWFGDITYDDDPYCELWTPEVAERVRGSYGYICVLCETPQNGKTLHSHHVLWNKKTCCDHSKRYILPLCNSCHTIVKGNKKKLREMWINEMVIMIESYYINWANNGKSFLSEEEWECIKDTPHIPLETRYNPNSCPA